MITLHHQDEVTQSSEITFDCPACKASKATGALHEQIDRVKLAYVIPLFKLRSTVVHCEACGENIKCTLPLEKAIDLSPEDLGAALAWYDERPVSIAGKLLAIVALLTSIFPFAGLVSSGLAVALSWNRKGWAAGLASFAGLVALVSTGCMLLVMFMP